MTIYYRRIRDTFINVHVSEQLAPAYVSKISIILNGFVKGVPKINAAKNTIDLFLSAQNCICEGGENITISESNMHWAFELIQALEEHMVRALDCTAVHGTCLAMSDESFMIVGPRMSGKTTLTRTLLGFDSVKLVGDDVICLLDDCVVGLGTPLLLRSGEDIVDGERFITIDDEGRERFLFHANASRLPTRWPNYLVFPQYNADCPPEICQMSSGDVFRNLMQNIRHHNTIQRLKEDVLRLANTPAYSIKYPSQQAAMMLLRQKIPCRRRALT